MSDILRNLLKIGEPTDLSDPTGMIKRIKDLEARVNGHDDNILGIIEDLRKKQKDIEASFVKAQESVETSKKALDESKIAYDNSIASANGVVETWNTFLDKNKRAFNTIWEKMANFATSITNYANNIGAWSGTLYGKVNAMIGAITTAGNAIEVLTASDNYVDILGIKVLRALQFATRCRDALLAVRGAINSGKDCSQYTSDIFSASSGQLADMKNQVNPLVSAFGALKDEMNALPRKTVS